MNNKVIKRVFLILIAAAGLGWGTYSIVVCRNNIKSNRGYEALTLYSMTEDRYLYLRDKLSKTQEMMFQEPMYNDGYYKLAYSAAEFSYFAKILDWIQNDYIIKMEPFKVLDVGCAYGTLMFYIKQNLPSAEVYGVDFIGTYFSKKLGAQNNINFSVANIEIEELPFKEKFDVIILTEVLEHFNYNPVSTLKKLAFALKDNGSLYLSTPDSSSGWGVTTKYYQSFDKIPYVDVCVIDKKCTNIDDHVWQYNLRELLYIINEAGFEVEKLEYTFSTPATRHFNLLLKKQLRK